ncbi:hypothetical protein CTM_16342 [Clostridium tetanomorphum DSM 665]|uniref:DUF6873 domain-containing protein n=1 Tax=Clostridium tetanomorphum TaxID=1553 RepID=A0A923J1S0_CLOTT|nr:hypothetical protein [Clostridium tetanomorphum]KAJ50748.1 hypothetical protein CTM_16342 [Clostridium tetanomorphum DSM 665]MBC2399521.1 hypothetical protein [Clostridium tetanomorphum]MBP1866546.1 hypothetical protein [Clostridium tetanomorphum]NRZ96161.1 hypothetical protein [Clostridium tetanomorphum]
MKHIIVDYRIESEEQTNLLKLGYKILKCPHSDSLYETVCGHPDMLMHIIDDKNIIVHKNMEIEFINTLKSLNYNVLLSFSELTDKYPYDIILNAVSLKNFFMHNIKYTDKFLLEKVNHKKIISVNQGYTKCSTAIIKNEAIITSDKMIASVMSKENIDVLLLPPGDIILPGLDYGFIGGCCGMIEENIIAFYGNLNHYIYGTEVMNFLYKHNVKPVFLREGKLVDRGSIYTIEKK